MDPADDAYAEDDLPDLVLDTRKDSSSSLEEKEDSNSSSVIDLLFNLSKERRSVSSTDVANWIDAGNEEIDQFDTEEVRKVTYYLTQPRPIFFNSRFMQKEC